MSTTSTDGASEEKSGYRRLLAEVSAAMKKDWEKRALSPEKFIATSHDLSQFDDSGLQEVEVFFGGIEYLLTPRSVVVDIGCGIGRMDQFVVAKVSRLIGVDVASGMVERARARFSGDRRAEFIVGNGYDLRLIESESVDLVFSHITFQHVPPVVVDAYARDTYRVLRRGGSLVFQIPESEVGEAAAQPPNTDTFEIRSYPEGRIRDHLVGMGFLWMKPGRHVIETSLGLRTQLRVHVRKP